MSKKNDLKLVFDFIAEYLKEKKEEPKAIKTKELLVEERETSFNLDDVLVKIKKPIDNVEADAAYIKQLMDRVESKTVERATTNNLLANQRKEFEREIKKLKEKASEDLKTEKVSDEIINNSGSTENIVTNDIESTITNNLEIDRLLRKQ